MKYTIAQKLVSTLALLITISFLGLISLHLVKQYHLNLSQGELAARNEAAVFVGRLQNKANRIESSFSTLCSYLSNVPPIDSPDESRAAAIMQSLLDEHSDLHQVYWIGEDGAPGRSAEPFRLFLSRDGPPLSARPDEAIHNGYAQLRRQSSGGSLLVGPYSAVNRDGMTERLVSLLVPVHNGAGRFEGAVGGDFKLADLQGALQSIRPESGYAAAIITESGEYLAGDQSKRAVTGRDEAVAGSTGSDNPAELPEAAYVNGEGDAGRLLRLTYPIEVAQGTWTFEMLVPRSGMLKPYYDSVKQTVVIALVALFLLIALMILLIRKVILNNIMKVVDVSSELAKGSARHKLDIRTRDEFGLLAVHFNRMIDYRKEADREANQRDDCRSRERLPFCER